MLYECKEKFVPLTKEVEQLNNFIRLYKLQIEERGTVHFQASKPNNEFKIAPLILIVFVENAFKHSQAAQSSDIEINIQLRVENNTLHFSCENNFEPHKNMPSVASGIGLKNVKKRLNLLYPTKHTPH